MAQNIMETAFEIIKRQSAVTELKCFVCGMKTGCNECEYLTDCEQRTYPNIIYVRNVVSSKKNLSITTYNLLPLKQ
jgi:hypothetical protein